VNESRNTEKLVHRILSGKLIFFLDSNYYELRKSSLDIKMEADFLYSSTYEDNLYNENFWLAEDIDNLLIELNILYYDSKKILQKIEKSLENAKIDLFKNYFDITKRSKIKTRISNLKNDIENIYSKQHSLDFLTLENYCDNIRHEFIISNTLYNKSNDLVFKKNNIDYVNFNNIISVISKNMIDVTTYKMIARCDYWKNYWSNNKTNVIDSPIRDWSEEQKSLINISCMYDKIYEHPECPQDDIINDDDALDGWMMFQKQKNDLQKKEKGVDSMLSGKIKNSSEIFLMAGNKDQAEDILGLNAQDSLGIIKTKVDTVMSKGRVRDGELPDVKQRIMQQLQSKGR
jgi:hypothetical protein